HTRFDCDWSSDVCSSDLHDLVAQEQRIGGMLRTQFFRRDQRLLRLLFENQSLHRLQLIDDRLTAEFELLSAAAGARIIGFQRHEIGRASCRESLWCEMGA